MTLDGSIVAAYTTYVGSAIGSLLPLWGVTVGVFLAFGIAERLAHLLRKMPLKLR